MQVFQLWLLSETLDLGLIATSVWQCTLTNPVNPCYAICIISDVLESSFIIKIAKIADLVRSLSTCFNTWIQISRFLQFFANFADVCNLRHSRKYGMIALRNKAVAHTNLPSTIVRQCKRLSLSGKMAEIQKFASMVTRLRPTSPLLFVPQSWTDCFKMPSSILYCGESPEREYSAQSTWIAIGAGIERNLNSYKLVLWARSSRILMPRDPFFFGQVNF